MTTLPLRNSVNRVLRLAPTLVVVVALAISAQLSAQDQHGYTLTEFNTPGFQDTFPQDINPRGTIVGYARSAINTGPAFVRAPDGSITTFDAPGAGTGSGQGTFPDGINEPGTITGYYIDNNDVSHGFLRTRTHGRP